MCCARARTSTDAVQKTLLACSKSTLEHTLCSVVQFSLCNKSLNDMSQGKKMCENFSIKGYSGVNKGNAII